MSAPVADKTLAEQLARLRELEPVGLLYLDALTDAYSSGQLITLAEAQAMVDRSAQAAVDWINGDYGIDEADAAELGIDGFIRAAATGTKEGE